MSVDLSSPIPAPALRRARPWLLATLLAVVIGGAAFLQWNRSPIHNAAPVFSRMTSDGIQIDVEHGDVRWTRLFCEDGQTQCTQRSAGVMIRFTLADGRSGGGSTFADATAPWNGGCRPGDDDPAVKVITTAGLGLPPGSADELFLFARTTPDVAKARVIRPDGSADEMAPAGNIVVLATRTGFNHMEKLQAFDAQGHPVSVC